jgi:hypothetical protein
MPSDDILAGMQLTAGEVVVLERRLQDAPDDLMIWSHLLGYYAGAMLASLDAAQHLERHALWLIENAPDADVTGCAFCGVGDSEQFSRAESLWRGHLERRPNDPRILTYAARFFQHRKPEFAEELIALARKVDPSGDWSRSRSRSATWRRPLRLVPSMRAACQPEASPRPTYMKQMKSPAARLIETPDWG